MAVHMTAGPEVGTLGLVFHSLPPGTAVVRRVIPQSWAAARGVQAEDEVLEMSGAPVAQMTREDFFLAMSVRPLQLAILRPSEEHAERGVATPPVAASRRQEEAASDDFFLGALEEAPRGFFEALGDLCCTCFGQRSCAGGKTRQPILRGVAGLA